MKCDVCEEDVATTYRQKGKWLCESCNEEYEPETE